LNSGQVIAGEIGSRAATYTAVGQQVGIAQRMESVAPPGGVMLSESTAQLVEGTVALGEFELHEVKGADNPVRVRQLLGVEKRPPRRRSESALVGRTRELNFLAAVLEEAAGGAGCVVNVVGPAGIGKSRLVREIASIAAQRGVGTFISYCESHTSDIPFHAISRLLRAATGIDDLDHNAARTQVRERFADADDDDLRILEDLLGIRDAERPLPDIAPEARRRRLTGLVNAASLTQTEPAVYVVEDVHWIDEISEAMLADFLVVIPQTMSMMLITSRPEYRGALTTVSGAQTIALRPLSEAQASTLATDLLGTDPSLAGVTAQVSTRAAGNPFFAEEMVRDLAERGVLNGAPGSFTLRGDAPDVDVPATVQATIGARIDRLSRTAKHTLTAAAVVGSRFDAELLACVVDEVDLAPLIDAEVVDQVRFGRRAQYAFRHPLIRAVAYESQLKSERGELHRRLAEAIESREQGSADENAALIAEHLEQAGDPHAAFAWHMRAGSWLTNRDIAAARSSWRRAQRIADGLPDDDLNRTSMRIAPRATLCGTAFRISGGAADTGFDELRDLCAASGDRQSLALGLMGLVTVNLFKSRRREASRLADELVALLESVGDPTLTIALSLGVLTAKHESGEMTAVLQVAERIIDLVEGDPQKGGLFLGSPIALALAMRGNARLCLGIPGWKIDLRQAIDIACSFDPLTLQSVNFYTYVLAIPYGAVLADAIALRDTAEVLSIAEHSADDMALFGAQAVRGMALVHQDGPDRDAGFELLAKARAKGLNDEFSMNILPIVDIQIARERTRTGHFDEAIAMLRAVLDDCFSSGGSIWSGLATAVLVEVLLQRCSGGDLEDAQMAVDRLAAVPVDPGFVLYEITLLRSRALLAQAHGDDVAYEGFRDRYRTMANELGFEGCMAWAEAMP
jgi:adenylate cyclase